MKTVRYGNQVPTFSVVGDYHHTFGPRAVRMFERWGVRFYPCQKNELDLFLARDRRNRYACRTICIAKPRQNGKSFGVRFYAIFCAAVEGKHVLFTAHRGDTVRKMFKFMRAFVLHTPDLAEKLLPGSDGIYKAAGSEGIYFSNGGLIEFATRTEGGARGETYDVIIFDEAQELTGDQYDAVVPTTIASESGDPQKIYLGTPPGPKCRGTIFRDYHDKAHGGGSSDRMLAHAILSDKLGELRALLPELERKHEAKLERATDVLYGRSGRGGLAKETCTDDADLLCFHYCQGESWASIARRYEIEDANLTRWCQRKAVKVCRLIDRIGMDTLADS